MAPNASKTNNDFFILNLFFHFRRKGTKKKRHMQEKSKIFWTEDRRQWTMDKKNRPLVRVTYCQRVSNQELLALESVDTLTSVIECILDVCTSFVIFVGFNFLRSTCLLVGTSTGFLARSERESSYNCYSNE